MPISEVLDQMIATLRMSDKTRDQDAGYLVLRKLSTQKRQSRKKTVKVEPFVVIDKK